MKSQITKTKLIAPLRQRNYKSQILILLICAAVLGGCRPKGILHSRQMREIIIDLHKTDALLYVKGGHAVSREAKMIYYAQVMENHGVTQAQFDSSLVWYTAHPALFDKIYPKVLKELKAEETAFLELYPEFGQPYEPTAEQAVPEQPVFTHDDLDSIFWVIQNGPCNSWKEWQRPYRIPFSD